MTNLIDLLQEPSCTFQSVLSENATSMYILIIHAENAQSHIATAEMCRSLEENLKQYQYECQN